MKNALLVRIGGLGDLLVALPSIRLVRWKYPRARLTLACRSEYGALLRERGVVDEVIPEDSRLLTPLFSGATGEKMEISTWLRSFDLIMGWSHGLRAAIPDPSRHADDPPAVVRMFRADPRVSGRLSRYFFDATAEAIGLGRALPIADFAFFPPSGTKRAATAVFKENAAGSKPFALVHPGSGSQNKRWPLPNFLRIIARLGERGVSGVLVTGEAEEKSAADVEQAVLPSSWGWLRRPALSDLALLLGDCGLYLGNDSGVTHLAAACGADVVALFRRDLAAAWAPLGRVELHVADSVGGISVDEVWEGLASRLPNFSADRQNL
jgi:ADP-heptose:LPS heptosyltransferase